MEAHENSETGNSDFNENKDMNYNLIKEREPRPNFKGNQIEATTNLLFFLPLFHLTHLIEIK